MSIQSLIMSNLKLTNLFMSKMPPTFWERQGCNRALSVFQSAAEKVPAYKDFLKQHGVDPNQVKTIEDFKKLPIMDKKNYVQKYDIEELCLDGTLRGKYTIETSSGCSGEPYFWPRLPQEDRTFPKYIEYAFRQFYGIDQRHTLVIITLSLGTWTSGEKMAQALREIAMTSSYPLTVMSPGTNIDETVRVVKLLSNKFEQTVIVGYPPFIKSVIEEGFRRGIDWETLNLKIGLGGEGYSEEWREYIATQIGVNEKDLLAVSGGYGAADVGMNIAREYPVTVLIRKLARKDRALAKELFGVDSVLPALLQYNAASVFTEEVDGELVFTAESAICAVRYNIHDRGGVVPYQKIMEILKSHQYDVTGLLRDHGYSSSQIWQLPFFYVFGRSDGTVSILGCNVYPENIELALYDKVMKRINRFRLSKTVDENQNESLCVFVEHKKGVKIQDEREKKELEKIYEDTILKELLAVNDEFRHVYEQKAITGLLVKVCSFEEDYFALDGRIKDNYVV